MKPQTKERIVGALVLLCLAIIFIPPMYDGRDPFSAVEKQTEFRAPHEPDFPSSEEMAESISPSADSRIEKIEKKVKADLPKSARSDSQLEKESESRSLSDFNAGEMTSRLLEDIAENSELMSRFSKDKKLKQAWAVQVASFTEAHRAQDVRDQLIANEFQAFIKTVVQDGTTISRVFAGVSLDKSIAEEIQEDLKVKLPDYETIIVSYQP